MRTEDYFAESMRGLRTQQGMSQKALAAKVTEKVGYPVDGTAVTRIEKGERLVRLGEAVAVADALGVALSALLPVLIDSDSGPLREWPRTSRLSPAVEVVSDYRGVRWRQISLDRWQSERGTFIAPFWFVAETWGPLREVAP